MTENEVSTSDFVLFGLDDKAKPRAALVSGGDREAALALAVSLKLQVLQISTAQQRVLAAELAPINLAEAGHGALPIVRRNLYSELEIAAQAGGAGLQTGSHATPGGDIEHAAATLWGQIQVGQIVLSQEDDPKGGWWEAVVLHKLEDDELLLRYRDYSPTYRFVRRCEQVALIRNT